MDRVFKVKAIWTPDLKRFIKQIVVSVISYFTLPFFRGKDNGVLLFFERTYNNNIDELIFDGGTGGYYEKIELSKTKNLLIGANVIDLGCGNNSFYYWLQKKHIPFNLYKGLDFAVNSKSAKERFEIIKDNILNFADYLLSEKNFILLCNVVCYLSDEEVSFILRRVPTDAIVTIIDPSPGLFWDAHFEGVKPEYRSIGMIERILQSHKYSIISKVQDYLMAIGKKHFLFPLSYCICAVHK